MLGRIMTDNSFSDRMFENIHKNLFDNINLQTVAGDFAQATKH